MDHKGLTDVSPVRLIRGAETLPEALVARLERCAEIRKVPRETLLVRQHTPIDELVVLLEGRVSTLVQFTGVGNLAVEYTGERGRIFGWSGLHPPHRAVDTVRAETPCTVMVMPMDEVRTVIAEQPAWAASMYSMVAGVLADRTNDIAAHRQPAETEEAPAGPQLLPESDSPAPTGTGPTGTGGGSPDA